MNNRHGYLGVEDNQSSQQSSGGYFTQLSQGGLSQGGLSQGSEYGRAIGGLDDRVANGGNLGLGLGFGVNISDPGSSSQLTQASSISVTHLMPKSPLLTFFSEIHLQLFKISNFCCIVYAYGCVEMQRTALSTYT